MSPRTKEAASYRCLGKRVASRVEQPEAQEQRFFTSIIKLLPLPRVTKVMGVCSEHFKPEYFFWGSTGKLMFCTTY